jgi:predicted GIY-YIG superfamily endonuclease
VWGVKSVPGGFDSHMPPPKERFQIHCKSDGSFFTSWKNVRKCIFIYKNSLRKTKEIENRIFKIIREEKRKTINYRKLQKRTISYKNNRKTL